MLEGEEFKKLSLEKKARLEEAFTYEEIKGKIWESDGDKS